MPREIRGLGMVVIFLLQGSLAWVPWRVGFNQGRVLPRSSQREQGNLKLWKKLRIEGGVLRDCGNR